MKHKSHGASTPRPQLTKHGSILGQDGRVVYREHCSKGDLVVPILCSCASSTLWHSVASDKDAATEKNRRLTNHYSLNIHWTLRLEQICLSLHHPKNKACVLQAPNLLSSDNSNNFAKPTAARPAGGMAAPNHLPPLARDWGELAAAEQEPLENDFVQFFYKFSTLKLRMDHESACQGQNTVPPSRLSLHHVVSFQGLQWFQNSVPQKSKWSVLQGFDFGTFWTVAPLQTSGNASWRRSNFLQLAWHSLRRHREVCSLFHLKAGPQNVQGGFDSTCKDHINAESWGQGYKCPRSCWIVWKIKSRHRPECQSGQNYCGQKGQQSHHVEYMWRLLLAQSVLASMFFARMNVRRSTGKQTKRQRREHQVYISLSRVAEQVSSRPTHASEMWFCKTWQIPQHRTKIIKTCKTNIVSPRRYRIIW